ncbi:MAG: GNAT family N-acetyltransferase [Candidatus Promineofilum sp.]|nr:GNAT family N-acetyltransferase [Promineifilum sp.]
MLSFDAYDIRDYRPDDAAALFVVAAAIEPLDAGQLVAWTEELEGRVEGGARVWVLARGRRLTGYALVELLPGLPGIYDLSGGVVPARRGRGLGGRLLAHVAVQAPVLGAQQLSARVETLEDEVAVFLLRRGFTVEHEECLLELSDLTTLPPVPDASGVAVVSLPRQQAIAEFGRLYEQSFTGRPWSQPYTEAEVAATLARADDLLFATVDGQAVGVVWHERLPDGRGRVEPIGIAAAHQGQGHGRRLLLAALHSLRQQGAAPVEIGLWRTNEVAMHLYKGLGFTEIANWYYLARNLWPES